MVATQALIDEAFEGLRNSFGITEPIENRSLLAIRAKQQSFNSEFSNLIEHGYEKVKSLNPLVLIDRGEHSVSDSRLSAFPLGCLGCLTCDARPDTVYKIIMNAMESQHERIEIIGNTARERGLTVSIDFICQNPTDNKFIDNGRLEIRFKTSVPDALDTHGLFINGAPITEVDLVCSAIREESDRVSFMKDRN